MKRIFKHRIEFGKINEIDLDMDANVVLCGIQSSEYFLWAENYDGNGTFDPWKRKFIIVGTGHDVDGSYTHVYSFQDGAFVWHVYEITGY